MLASVATVFREVWTHKRRIVHLARYEKTAKTNDTFLGKLWDFLSPALQICVYWFVFGIGLKVRASQGNYPFIVWLVAGMCPWFCVSNTMQKSASLITSNSMIIENLNIPRSIIPAKDLVIHIIDHLWMLLFVMIVLIFSGVTFSWYMFQTVYYFIAMCAFLFAFSLFSSSVGAVVKDFPRVLSPIIRLLFYISYTVSPMADVTGLPKLIMDLNPIAYITVGYRNSLLYETGFWTVPLQTCTFWGITVILMLVGCRMHCRIRERFADLI